MALLRAAGGGAAVDTLVATSVGHRDRAALGTGGRIATHQKAVHLAVAVAILAVMAVVAFGGSGRCSLWPSGRFGRGRRLARWPAFHRALGELVSHELRTEPTEQVVHDRRGAGQRWISREARRLEARARKLVHEELEGHAVLQSQ